MKIIVASDHAGYPLKQFVLEHLAARGLNAADGGPATDEVVVDYPDFASLVGRSIRDGQFDRGILICGTGLGMSIAANRLHGIRAAVCWDVYTARQSRAHNDANVLCMGAWVVTPQRAIGIVDEWLDTKYEHGRHVPRLAKIEQLSNGDQSRGGTFSTRLQTVFRLTISLSPNETVFAPLLFAGRLEQGIRTAAEAGFDAVELSLRTAQDIDVEKVRGLLQDIGLGVSGIATGQSYLHDSLSFCHPDPDVRAACVERIKSLVPIAALLDAVLIFGGIRGRFLGDRETFARQREGAIQAMREVIRLATDQGVRVVVEPINRYETNFINTAVDALTLIDEIGEPSVKVLLDTFHMNIEEADIPGALREAGSRLGYIHFADSNRRAPGQGHTDFIPILTVLSEMGYAGPIGTEILPIPDDRSAALQAGSFLKALGSSRTQPMQVQVDKTQY